MNTSRVVKTIVATFLLLTWADLRAQTCSCASVPLLGTMELATPGDGKWFVASTYEYHDVSELVSGSTTLPNRTGRERTSEALLFEVSRRLVGKLSFSALVSAVRHDRSVGAAHESASGLGDSIFLLKYSPTTISLYSRTTFSGGLGVRLPTGSDNEVSNGGIVLAEDMQPSTGAFGSIVWLYAARALNEPATARLYANATYTHNDDNDRNYQFGHETTASFGASYQTQSPWGFNAELLYRSAERDKRASSTIPNTGGEWLDFVPAVQYHLSESMALRASAKIPVYRSLHDQLQFTTKYSFRLTFSYVFGN